jgi:hypothetical protein
MSEQRTAYQVKEPNPSGIPIRWLNFLQRVARLERGKVYNITVIIPECADSDPQWAISGSAKVENGGWVMSENTNGIDDVSDALEQVNTVCRSFGVAAAEAAANLAASLRPFFADLERNHPDAFIDGKLWDDWVMFVHGDKL